MITKTKIRSALIFIGVGQLIALFIWLVFNHNYFVILMISSTVGFIVSYKEKKTTKKNVT
jgi:4-hydroxybenzoate polyprenyltransferase